MSMFRLYPQLVFFSLLSLFVALLFAGDGQGTPPQKSDDRLSAYQGAVKREAGMFRAFDQDSRNQPHDIRFLRYLRDNYQRRAYPGAPPFIPHPVKADMKAALDSCLSCHEKGGFVKAMRAYAPVTPHPELGSCQQCHVQSQDVALFRDNDWWAVDPPKIGRSSLPGGPVPIPHTLQMRENCSACHAGPAAPVEIRISHPERISCRQCHMATDE